MGRWMMEDGEEPDALCGDCGDGLYAEEVSTEGWERYGALLCTECFSTRITDEADEDPECTTCEGTGITIQTERRCACQPPEGCFYHPDRPVREVLDGDALCQECCDQWAHNEGNWQAQEAGQ